MFDPWNHDNGDKIFSSFYDNTIIKGKEGDAGAKELQEVIDMIFEYRRICISYLEDYINFLFILIFQNSRGKYH